VHPCRRDHFAVGVNADAPNPTTIVKIRDGSRHRRNKGISSRAGNINTAESSAIIHQHPFTGLKKDWIFVGNQFASFTKRKRILARACARVCNEEDTLMVDKYTKNTFNALNNLSSAVSHERGSRSWYLQNSYLMLQEHGSSFSSDFARLSSLLDRIARTFIDTHAREEIRPALPILPLGALTKILYYKANLVLRITRYWSRAHALRRNNLT